MRRARVPPRSIRRPIAFTLLLAAVTLLAGLVSGRGYGADELWPVLIAFLLVATFLEWGRALRTPDPTDAPDEDSHPDQDSE